MAKTWLWLGSLLLIASGLTVFLRQSRLLTDLFFSEQDLPVLVALMTAAGCLLLLDRTVRLPCASANFRSPAVFMLFLALSCGVVAWLGARLIFDDYPLSLDEFMATFGAAIHSRGQVLAPTPDQWRDYAWALQPYFAFITDDGAYWTSAYLPVNAALRGAMDVLGAQSLASPLLAVVSIVAVWAVGRRIWPDRPLIALLAAVLMASSSQFLMMAMTPYAMSAHLAFNLVWLWLFLRGDRLSHAGAIVIGFLACGLHQLAFHPLFVAPFVLQLWLDRRWRLATLYTLAYLAICLFWINYWSLILGLVGETTPPEVKGAAQQAFGLLAVFDPAAVGLMAKNLIRFATWQNPLTAPLIVLGALGAWRVGGTLRSLIAGLALTTFAMLILMPYQSHGWGYRYLHGLLGSACLLAAWAYARLTRVLPATEETRVDGAFVVVAAVSILVLFPIRAWQAHHFAHPYALAYGAVGGAKTQLVLVDDAGSWFTIDLVRNDPYLQNRPIVLSLADLEPGQFAALCSRYTISIFDPASARTFGIRTMRPAPKDPGLAGLVGRACGDPAESIKEIRGKSA